MAYTTFVYGEKQYVLDEAHFADIIQDEEKPIEGIDVQGILDLMRGQEAVQFAPEYYTSSCENCHAGRAEKAKRFKFLEYHFYLFTMKGRYVMSSLSEAYEGKTLDGLIQEGVVDDSTMVSIQVCENCGEFVIELSYCDF